MWWAETVNYGLSYISREATVGDFVILLNDDINLDYDSIPNLVQASQHNPNALIGAINLILDAVTHERRVYSSGGFYNLLTARHKSNIAPQTIFLDTYPELIETDFLYGRLLIIPWLAFNEGHFFDSNNFPQYSADEDFTYSVKLRGYPVYVSTKSVVFVNAETTAKFNLSFRLSGIKGVLNSMTSFNSCYNLKQTLIFARKYSPSPIIYTLCRFSIILYKENIQCWLRNRSS